MKIELDGISLDQTEESPAGGIADARSVSYVETVARRQYVRHDIPGMEGSVFQDMGRSAVRIGLEGTISGKNALAAVEMLRSRFKRGEPVSFVSNASGASDITRVVIVDLRVAEAAGTRGRYDYALMLKEYHEPGE